ncbi:MAG: TIR domain-containing protein [Hyphomonadaceae bacterium]
MAPVGRFTRRRRGEALDRYQKLRFVHHNSRRMRRLGMVGDMSSKPLPYWKPGSEERKLRIFISHRYEQDEALYSEVIAALNSQGFDVQDVSLSAGQQMAGPRGGELPKLKIQAEIAARIYTSDILIAPSRVGAGRSEWVTWEVQLAAIGYGIPILFVDQGEDQQRRTALVSEVADVGLPHAVCNPVAQEIVPRVVELVGGRPNWTMRDGESDALIRYRGPPSSARDDVLRKIPFEARLAAFATKAPEAKRGFWPFK